MNGILNINKPINITSHDVVASIRRLLKQRRVGHAGTLDPAASGVLPICVGEATRVAEYLSDSGKAYLATIVFGTVTDTYDSEGVILRTASTVNLTRAGIEHALEQFVGPQMQVPPRYSAIKVQGQPAYKRTRAGEDITLEPRPVVISVLSLVEWNPPALVLSIACSKGTYIRSLAHDLGERLGCGAYLHALTRTCSGPFALSESITLEQLAEAIIAGTVEQYLYPPDKALEHFPAIVLDTATAERVKHGNAFRVEGGSIAELANGGNITDQGDLAGARSPSTRFPSFIRSPLLARVYDNEQHFLAIAEWDEEQQLWKPRKVFAHAAE